MFEEFFKTQKLLNCSRVEEAGRVWEEVDQAGLVTYSLRASYPVREAEGEAEKED